MTVEPYDEVPSSDKINGRCWECHIKATLSKQSRTISKSGRSSCFSFQQRSRVSHNSSTSPRFPAASGLYGRIPFNIASLTFSRSQSSYGTCPQSTCHLVINSQKQNSQRGIVPRKSPFREKKDQIPSSVADPRRRISWDQGARDSSSEGFHQE